jgi:hypothetical protein
MGSFWLILSFDTLHLRVGERGSRGAGERRMKLIINRLRGGKLLTLAQNLKRIALN